jgi:hypothetical protein
MESNQINWTAVCVCQYPLQLPCHPISLSKPNFMTYLSWNFMRLHETFDRIFLWKKFHEISWNVSWFFFMKWNFMNNFIILWNDFRQRWLSTWFWSTVWWCWLLEAKLSPVRRSKWIFRTFPFLLCLWHRVILNMIKISLLSHMEKLSVAHVERL